MTCFLQVAAAYKATGDKHFLAYRNVIGLKELNANVEGRKPHPRPDLAACSSLESIGNLRHAWEACYVFWSPESCGGPSAYGFALKPCLLVGSDSALPAQVRSTFDSPTPIQSMGRELTIRAAGLVHCHAARVGSWLRFCVFSGWPTALSGRDMVGIAQTGSGEAGKFTH